MVLGGLGIGFIPGLPRVGLRPEYLRRYPNAFSGGEFQPNIRARYLMGRNQIIWGAVSRAVRVPSRFELDRFSIEEEFYTFRENPRDRVRVLLRLDAAIVRVSSAGRWSWSISAPRRVAGVRWRPSV